jgi:hypothetical protein
MEVLFASESFIWTGGVLRLYMACSLHQVSRFVYLDGVAIVT